MTSAGAGLPADLVAARIERDIVAGGLPVGTVLGSEADLRRRFDVGRSVIRQAVRLVEHHDVARMRRGPGGGLVVVAPRPAALTGALAVSVDHAGTTVQQLLEARLVLEPLAARLAAAAAPERSMARMRAEVFAERTRRPGPGSHDGTHHILGEFSANPALAVFIPILTGLTTRRSTMSHRTRGRTLDAKRVSHGRHVSVVEALLDRAPADAGSVIAVHLREVSDCLAASRTEPSGAPVEEVAAAGRTLAEVTADRVVVDIVRSGWRVGEVLGSETDLCERYGVYREVLRQAVRLLEHHGAARMRRGRGGGLVIERPDPSAGIRRMALLLARRRPREADLAVVREVVDGSDNPVLALFSRALAEVRADGHTAGSQPTARLMPPSTVTTEPVT